MTKFPLPGLTFWVLLVGVLLLWGFYSLDKTMHLPYQAPSVVPGTAKAIHQVWHFTSPSGDVRVVTPEQVSLAKHFGPRVYKYAQQIIAVNDDSQFPSNRLLMAIAATESSFRKDAESSTSVGLLQINYSAHNLKREDLFDVKANVKHSIRILRSLNKQCSGNLKCTLLSYNVGHKGYMEKRYDIEYYNKVLKYYNM